MELACITDAPPGKPSEDRLPNHRQRRKAKEDELRSLTVHKLFLSIIDAINIIYR
jgi:hypothetical protein